MQIPQTQAGLKSATHEFLKTIGQLSDLMDHENALLEERKYRELEKIQPEKSRLAAEYNIAMQALRPFKNMLQHDHQDIRNELTKANEAFQDKVTNNGRHLMRSKSISEGIISSIAQEAERQSPTVKQYNPMHPNGGASQTRSVPIAINETV